MTCTILQLYFKRDPLRGALFENMVILELVKHRLNQGKSPNLYYHRDNHKNEIDIIFKYGHLLHPIEIKSAETFSSHFLKNIKHYQKIAGDRVASGYVVYAGKEHSSIQGTDIIHFQNMDSMWRKIEENG